MVPILITVTDHLRKRPHRAIRPPLSQMRAAELCGYLGRTGRRWAAGDLDVSKAVEIMIRLMLETGCAHPEDLLSSGQRVVVEKVMAWVRRYWHMVLLGRSRLDHLGCIRKTAKSILAFTASMAVFSLAFGVIISVTDGWLARTWRRSAAFKHFASPPRRH